jgi:tetratricopeptide (TPR) repeat protein
MAGARTFVVRFLADAEQYKKGIKEVNDGMGGLKTEVSSLLPSFKTMAIVGAAAFGAVTAFATEAVQAAMEDEKSQSLLAEQLKRTFGEQQGLTDAVERYISMTQLRTGTSDVELRDSLGTLIRVTGNLKTAQNLLTIAQDISVATGKDLASVSLAVAKASMGQFTALGKLGIPLDDSTKKSKDFGKILDNLQGQFGGAADAAANTFGGKLKIVKDQFGEIIETIGAALIPYLDKFAKFLVDNVAPSVQRITSVISENGLIAGFQQLLFEAGKSGTGLVGVFEKIAVAAAISANVIYRAFYIAKAQIDLLANPTAVIGDLAKAFGDSAIDVDALKKSFDAIAVPVNHYAVKGIPTAILAQQRFGIGAKDLTDTLAGTGGGGGGGVAKAVKTATEKLKVYTDALKSSNSAHKSFTAAQKASVKAGESLTAANQGVTDAQDAFNQAVAGYGADSPQAKKAAKELELAQRGLERAGYNVEGSLFAIADAEAALKKVRADPESTPQAIREAEIALAEAKLSSADAIDQQTEATTSLDDASKLLNQTIFGAAVGSAIYTQLSDALTDAKDKQADAVDAVAEAIEREAEALDKYREAIRLAGEVAAKYPVVVAANPMAGIVDTIPATVTGNSTGFNPDGSTIIINVNAGIVASPDQVAQELSNLSDRYRRLNGGGGFF